MTGGWKVAPVTISTWDGKKVVRGYVCADVPGLAVTPDATHGDLWTVTHLISGRATEIGSRDAESAMSLAIALSRAGDWARDTDAVWADARLISAGRRVIRRALATGDFQSIDRACDPGLPEHIRTARRASVGVAQ
jgi:hypothetical protein